MDLTFRSLGNEIEIFGIFVKRMSQTSQWHVPGSVPGNGLLFWSEKNLVSSQGGSFWGVSQVSRLRESPQSGFAQFIVVGWNDLSMRISEGSVVSEGLSSPDIRDSGEDTSKIQRYSVGFSHFGDEDNHQEGSGIEVSDGDLLLH